MDKALSSLTGYSRIQVRKFLSEGKVRVDGKVMRIASRLARPGMRIELFLDPSEKDRLVQHKIPIIFQSRELLVVNKPAGLPVSPTRSQTSESVERLMHGQTGKNWRAVHRLDQPVSGVLMLAHSDKAIAQLSAWFKARQVAKTYHALLHHPERLHDGEWRDLVSRKGAAKMGDEGAREAVTRVYVLGNRGACALAQLEPVTGRYHQLRIQAALHDVPVVGDKRYGAVDGAPRLFLHAAGVRLTAGQLPDWCGPGYFSADPPEDFFLYHGGIRRPTLPMVHRRGV
ncbi:MAG: hypothetical protein GMKNLPBB_02533 [Myxococcota bacterium]|nr:hypothetical protein [Myxococcota bacterium]